MSLIILHFRHVGSYFSHQWLILEVFFLFRAPSFWDDVFILGHSHLTDFLCWDLTSCLWLFLWMDYRDDDILGSLSSAHLVQRGYPFTYVTRTFYLWHHYTYIHLVLLELYWYFTLSLPFSSSYMILSHSLDQMRGCRPILSFLVECLHIFGH